MFLVQNIICLTKYTVPKRVLVIGIDQVVHTEENSSIKHYLTNKWVYISRSPNMYQNGVYTVNFLYWTN